LPAKKRVKKASAQEEQLQLLRQILAELQTLNASLGAGMAARQAAIEPVMPSDDQDDDEELEEYE
jgi:hypothetical protein